MIVYLGVSPIGCSVAEGSGLGIARPMDRGQVYKPQVHRSTTTVRRRPQNFSSALPGSPGQADPCRSCTAENWSRSGALRALVRRWAVSDGGSNQMGDRPVALEARGAAGCLISLLQLRLDGDESRRGGRWGIGPLPRRIACPDATVLKSSSTSDLERDAATSGVLRNGFLHETRLFSIYSGSRLFPPIRLHRLADRWWYLITLGGRVLL